MIALLWMSAALAWDSTGYVWPEDAFPVPYWIDVALGEDDDAWVTAIQAGFQTWEDAGCGVSFAYQGRTSDATFGGEADGINAVFFLQTAWPDDAALVSTPSLYTAGDELAEGDLALNGQTYGWATDGADGRMIMDVQAAITHEVGHLLGLWHSTDDEATLNPALDGNPEGRTLAADDLEGLCTIYAESSGGGVQGDACDVQGDCADGYSCVLDGRDTFCAQECSDDVACEGAGLVCSQVSADVGVCAEADGKTGCGCASGGQAPGALAALAALLLGLRRRR